MKHHLLTFSLLVIAAGIHAEDLQLFNGQDLSAWKEPLGAWSVVSDVKLDPGNPKGFVATPGLGVSLSSASGKSVDIMSKAEHGDAQIHVEFNVPKDSNSGVYVQGRYEVQVFDSFGKATIAEHDCGAIYQRWDPARGKGNEGYEGHTPKENASNAPGEWQSFDITFRAPRFDAAGKKTADAVFVKVLHNGKVIHENVVVHGPTRGSKFPQEAATGPIVIQGDHGPVAYRKLTITPL